MNLVYRHGSIERVLGTARSHPVVVAPLVLQIPNYRGGTRRFFVENAKGISLVANVSFVIRNDVKLIERSLGDFGDKSLPDSRTPTGLQRVS